MIKCVMDDIAGKCTSFLNILCGINFLSGKTSQDLSVEYLFLENNLL